MKRTVKRRVARLLRQSPRTPAPASASPSQWKWFGDEAPSVLVAGHSHRNAYSSAVAEGLAPGAAVLIPAGPVDPAAPLQVDGKYWQEACRAPGRVLAVVWNGNQHNWHFLFPFEQPFRLHDCGEHGTVVPASMISAFFEPSLAGMDLRERLRVDSVRAEHTAILGTPPPKAEEEIRTGLQREPLLLEAVAAAGESVDTIPITSVALRVGLWKILQGDLAAWAARLGAVFVPVPASAQTADGCLKPEYSVGDSSHANGAFGALMLGEIESALAQAEVVRA
jgi:hypothetical protein